LGFNQGHTRPWLLQSPSHAMVDNDTSCL
jgi:hypothetical protein